MGVLAIVVAFGIRAAMVALFLPFSAWDKIAGFSAAIGQARSGGFGRTLGTVLVCLGIGTEIIASLCILSGVADRLAAVILAGYCVATAILFKGFWRDTGSAFHPAGDDAKRADFFDFWKNLAVAGGFLALGLGATAGNVSASLGELIRHPFASTQPYRSPQAYLPDATSGQ